MYDHLKNKLENLIKLCEVSPPLSSSPLPPPPTTTTTFTPPPHTFPSYFNLFVSIFMQYYVKSNLQVSIIYILIILKARNSETFRFVHLLASVTINAPYFHYIIQTIGHVSIPKRYSFSPLCLFCACGSSVLQNFKISTHLLTEVEFEPCV